MLKEKALFRPDRQLEKMLVSLVYAVIALALSILMLFIFPHHSLLFLGLTLVLTSLVIALAIALISDSERALTYGGFANVILESKEKICRIDNVDFIAVIENKLSADFFKGSDVLPFLKKHILPDSQNQQNIERLEHALKNLKSENVLFELVFKGESHFFTVSLTPLYLKKNDIFESDFSVEKIQKETYFFWNIEDITPKQNMEKIIEQERQKLHLFIESMPMGLYVLDEQNSVEYANETLCSQLNMKKEEIIGKPFSNLINVAQSALLNPSLIEQSGLFFFQNSKQENIELFVSQNRYKEGNCLKTRGLTLKGLPTDATLSNLANKMENEYKLLFSYMPTAVCHVLSNGAVSEPNPKAIELLGNDLQNAHIQDFFEKSDLKRMEQIYADYAKNFKPHILTEVETTLKSGTPVLLTIAPRYLTYLQKTTFDGLTFFITDTTKNKNLVQQFAQAQKMQAMGQFAGGIAHDFNNLLTAMIGYCDLLLQRHRIGDPSFADLAEIKRSAVRAAALVRQLLVYSKQQPSHPKYIDIVENLADLSQFLKRIMGEQITLEITHAPDLGFIRIDPVHFTQVVMNLCTNAKDAMNGKGKLHISTHLETILEPTPFGEDTVAPGDFIVLSVKDTGTGIKKENLSRIFDPFFSTKQNVVGSGTGLGLATVYGIISQLKGLIKIESEWGKGTTFKIYFPRVVKPADKEEPKEDKTSSVMPVLTSISKEAPKLVFGLNVNKTVLEDKPVTDPSKVKILFVEDETAVRTFALRALKKKGFDVIGASSAENALEQSGPFDLMITDMVMPGITGAELASIMKKKQPNIKIIIASGYSEEMARKDLSSDDDFTFLAKPYSLGDLTQKVSEVLNGGTK